MASNKFEVRRTIIQKQFDDFSKERDNLLSQSNKNQERIGTINQELLRLQGRFSELKELLEQEKLENIDRGEEKIADLKEKK